MKPKNIITLYCPFLLVIAGLSSCTKVISNKLPQSSLLHSNVFTSNSLVNGALNGMYAGMTDINSYAAGSFSSLFYMGGESSDDFLSASSDDAFYTNNILPDDYNISVFWNYPYRDIYRANAILEGLPTAKGVTDSAMKEAEGEAKFIRAFSYFYLVNMFGDMPLVLTTDYKENTTVTRTPKEQVYQQMVTDLKDAQSLLAGDFSVGGGQRIRPNKWAATALLARVYLYTEKWTDAAAQATAVINSPLFSLPPVDKAFLMNSSETIWAFGRTSNTEEAQTVSAYEGSSPFLFSLDPNSVARFDPGDLRLADWIMTTQGYSGETVYYPYKYQNQSSKPITEYSIVLRLAEQYLIRAEARAHQDLITGAGSAAEDIKTIRTRAGLSNTTASNQDDMLLAIENERYFELFSEWAHRWFDLKRTGRAAAVLSSIPAKAPWASFKELYPIPQSQINNDPAMAGQQNPGYH